MTDIRAKNERLEVVHDAKIWTVLAFHSSLRKAT